MSDLGTFEEVEKSYLWRQAMADEINSSQRNGTWELYELPSRKKEIRVKWIYKTKYKPNGKI